MYDHLNTHHLNIHRTQRGLNRFRNTRNAAWLPIAALSFTAAITISDTAHAEDEAAELGKVVVTARNREEIAQDVPLPVQVIGGAQLDREDIKTVWDLSSKAPNLQLNPPGENARKVSPSIRGLGRSPANDSMEQSVGVIVDGVTLYYSGQAWSDYVDLDRIEVLRGPQGTLMGKNTTLGAINIVTKAPSFTPSSSFELSTGDFNTLSGKFSATGPINEQLAYRGTFVVDRADGIYTNTYQSLGHAKETWRETNKISGRFQLLWTPTESLSGRFIFDKLRSDERVNTGNVLVSNGPTTYADGTARPTVTPIGGYTPSGTYVNYGYLGRWTQRSAWFHNTDGSVYQPKFNTTDIENSEARPQLTNQYGVSAQFDWSLANYTLTSITAYRYQDFDIKNGGQNGPFYISNSGQQLWNDQISQELRLASAPAEDRSLDYQVGLYYLDAEVYSDDPTYYGQDAGAWNASASQFATLITNGAGRELMRKSLDGMYQSSVTDATVKSLAAYAQADWHITDKATATFGVRQTEETKRNRITQQLDRAGEDLDTLGTAVVGTSAQIAAAKAIRSAQITTPFDWVNGNKLDFSLTAWNFSPSYKLTNDVLVYGSAGQGVKSGFIYFLQATQPTAAGFETDLKPEKSLDFEAGIKSLLLKRRLQLNANLYYTRVTDYQASWTRESTVTPGTFVTGWGNAPKVLARGVELESAYQLTKDLSVTANGAYNLATYEAQWLVQVPEISTTSYFNAKGNQIANVPKITGNVGVNYHVPVFGYLGRVTLSNTYRSGAYLNDNHSRNTYQEAYTVSNLGVGVGSQDKKWELSVLVRNVFNSNYAYTLSTWTNNNAATETIGAPRSLTVAFKAKL